MKQPRNRYHNGRLLPYRVYYNIARKCFVYNQYDKDSKQTRKSKGYTSYNKMLAYACHRDIQEAGAISSRNMLIAANANIPINAYLTVMECEDELD